MNSIETITPAVEILRSAGVPFALLHCTNVYPTPPELVRLRALEQLRLAFPDAVIGLSDHTVTNHACFGAVALGASLLERHFTDSANRPGPDIVCSMDPNALTDLIVGSKIIWSARGGDKFAVEEESQTIAFAFASVVAERDICAGDILSKDNIWVKRPGGGDFKASDYQSLLGRRAIVDIEAGLQLKKTDIE